MSELQAQNLERTDYTLSQEVISALREAISQENKSAITKLSKELHPADISEFLSLATGDQRRIFLENTHKQFDPDTLLYLEGDVKDDVVQLLGIKETAKAIKTLDVDEAVQVIEDLEEDEQQEILQAIPKKQREELEEGLAWPEDSAGRIMDTRYVAVPEDSTVGKTIDYLRKTDDLPDDFYSIFVVDTDNQPIGYTLVSRVMRNKRGAKMHDLMEGKIRSIKADMDQEEVAYIFQKYALTSAPVVNDLGGIIGVIYIDDIADVIDEEAEEDIMRLGGVVEADVNAPIAKTAFQRMPWLLVNLVTAIAASAVIAKFDSTIESLVVLAVLMPIVASMAGNAGTQTLTVAVRSIATKELTTTNAVRVVWKEIMSALLNGVLFGALVAVCSFAIYQNIQLSLIFGIATIASLVIAAFFGAFIPLWLERTGVDPAVSSGVFLTTITDISAFFIFLGLASLWLV